MSYDEKDLSTLIAERIVEYDRKKRIQEYQRQQRFLEHKQHMKLIRKRLLLLTVASSMLLVLCGIIVTLEMQVREREKNVSALRLEISALKQENQEAEKRLSQNADYEWVREEAMKLGMSRAKAENVVFYSVAAVDYMEQHKNIPIE